MEKVYIVVDMFRAPVAVFSTGKKAFDYVEEMLNDSEEDEYWEVLDFVVDVQDTDQPDEVTR